MSDYAQGLPVVIIGAGPVGLAAAANLLSRGFEPLILEAGPAVGHAIRHWAHVKMFSPWSFNVDQASRALLERQGWKAPCGTAHPTGGDLVEKYLDPLAATPELQPRLRFNERVTAIARVGVGKVRTAGRDERPFEIHTVKGQGHTTIYLARAVIDASGTWGYPNPAGPSGVPVPGELEAVEHIAYGMPDILGPDRTRYAGRRVVVLGSGHSAIGNLIELVRLAETAPETKVIWAVRKSEIGQAYGGGKADKLAERGALGQHVKSLVESGRITTITDFAVSRIEQGATQDLHIIAANGQVISADRMIVATGLRPNLDMLREIRLGLDPALECPVALAPLIDPNVHSCGTVRPHGASQLSHPESGFFIAGMKSYGRAPTFLLATGYEQVRSIAAWLAGDMEAANRVELQLPETGVCSLPKREVEVVIAKEKVSCCGAAA